MMFERQCDTHPIREESHQQKDKRKSEKARKRKDGVKK